MTFLRAVVKKVIIIHGFQGNPSGGWKGWLKTQLEQKGIEVIAPQFPDPDHPKKAAWVKQLAKVAGKPSKDTIIIGHSLGCPAILRYLETLKDDEMIGGAVLVAGPITTKRKELKSFFTKPFDYKKIKKHCKSFIAINSDDDYHIPLEHGKTYKKELGAKLIIKKKHKHFGSADGFTELPIALESILSLIKINKK